VGYHFCERQDTLITRNRPILEKHITASHLVWKHSTFYGNVRIITVFSTVKISGLSRMNPIYLTSYVSKGTHTRTSQARESASGSLTREPGSDIFHHTRTSGFRLVTLHTRTSLTHWNPSPAGLASQTRTCMGTLKVKFWKHI
jgi:hypothetical protein